MKVHNTSKSEEKCRIIKITLKIQSSSLGVCPLHKRYINTETPRFRSWLRFPSQARSPVLLDPLEQAVFLFLGWATSPGRLGFRVHDMELGCSSHASFGCPHPLLYQYLEFFP